MKPTLKHREDSVIVWGCISSIGVSELVLIVDVLDKNRRLGVLKNNLLKSTNNMGIQSTFKFYQDNDPKRNARIVQEYLLYNPPKVVHPPPQFPNLNPIENLWDQLNQRIRETSIN